MWSLGMKKGVKGLGALPGIAPIYKKVALHQQLTSGVELSLQILT